MKAIRTRASIGEGLPGLSVAQATRSGLGLASEAHARLSQHMPSESLHSAVSGSVHDQPRRQGRLRARRGYGPIALGPTSTLVPACDCGCSSLSPTSSSASISMPKAPVQPANMWSTAWKQSKGRRTCKPVRAADLGYEDMALARDFMDLSLSHSARATHSPRTVSLSSTLIRPRTPQPLDTRLWASRAISTTSIAQAQLAAKQTYNDDPPYDHSHLPFHPPAPPYPSDPSSSRPSQAHRMPSPPGPSSRKLAHASAFADDFDFRTSFADEPGDAGQDDVGWYGEHDAHVHDYMHRAGVPEVPQSVKDKAMKKLLLWNVIPSETGTEAAREDDALDALTREDILAMDARVVQPGVKDQVENLPADSGLDARTRQARRTKLPPLPPPKQVPDSQARYDWRATAPSQLARKKAKRWYPEAHHERHKAIMRGEDYRAATPPEPLDEEAQRYADHFTLLLEAELAEIRMQHAYRLTEWSEKRLVDEGFMLHSMVASEHTPYRSSDRAQTIYQFRKNARGDAALLKTKHHKFKQGACVELSRLHPQIDHINATGEPVQIVSDQEVISKYLREKDGHEYELPPYDASERLFGTVFFENAHFIRIAFPVPIQDIEVNEWRIDTAYNDFVIRRQIDKLQSLFSDPVAAELDDALMYGVAATRVPSIKGDHAADPIAANGEGASKRKRYRLVLPEQTIFDGSALRDLLLRGFQQTYLPYTANAIDDDLRIQDEHEALTVMEVPVPAAAGVSSPNDSNASALIRRGIESATASGMAAGKRSQPSLFMRHPGIRDWVERHRHGSKVKAVEGDPDLTLNESQTRAIAMMLGERLSLVQGPPGTGKTRTIIEAIKLLKLHWKIPHPTLVTAHTNAAVDNLAAGLHEHGVKVVRIGVQERIRPDIVSRSLESLMEQHPMHVDVEKHRLELQSLQITINECQKQIDGWMTNGQIAPYASPAAVEVAKEKRLAAYDRVSKVKTMLRAKQAIMRKEVLVDADVICATCLSSVKADLDVIDFPIVFLDEASMATEPLSWLPLTKGSMHVAIIGDHKQLPPVITSSAAHLGGLSTSMFERLIREGDIPSIMLDTQYRMHPQISSFPNEAFYAGALHDGSVDATGQAYANLSPPDTFWLKQDAEGRRVNFTFVDTDAPESPRNLSIANEREADLVCDVVSDLLAENPDLRGADIGVITPYIAQISLLEQYLGPGDPVRSAQFKEYLGPERARELADIEIKTVDGFEGREKDVIIFSTVRSNDKGYIGFLADWRRLNVGLTRAKRGLIMIGSASTLSKARIGLQAQETLPKGGAEVWRKLMKHIKDKDLILSVDVPAED